MRRTSRAGALAAWYGARVIGVRARIVASTVAAAALAFAGLAPACGSRPGACPGFDSCSDAKPCPRVRCVCDGGSEVLPATCRSDGTCWTVSDCPALCAQRKSSCAKPPASCEAYLATECECSSTTTRFTEVWDCARGDGPLPSGKDCDDACGAKTGSGGAGGGSATGGGFGGAGGGVVSLSSSAVTTSTGN
jgi:hypothetical protein